MSTKRLELDWDRQHLDVEVDARHQVAVTRADATPNLADPVTAVRDALEEPLDYPALRRALTPDDHVAIVVDERLPQLGMLLVPVLEVVTRAGVAPERITLVCPPSSKDQPWVDDLPDEFQDVRIEVHQPEDRRKLSYLATTKQGRRIYLNRSVVDADQAIVLSRRWYDPLLGIGGGEGALYPALADAAVLAEVSPHLDARAPGREPWPLRKEATEVAWLLGAPFLVQVIEGSDDGIAQVVAGPIQSSAEGQRLLERRWRVEAERHADVVVATLCGDPAHHTLDDFARAFLNASHAVRTGGAVVLLTDASPELGPSFELFRRVDDPGAALRALEEQRPADRAAGFMWASAACHAKLYLLSGLADDLVEELLATPLQQGRQVARLLEAGASFLYLPDANKTLAVVRRASPV